MIAGAATLDEALSLLSAVGHRLGLPAHEAQALRKVYDALLFYRAQRFGEGRPEIFVTSGVTGDLLLRCEGCLDMLRFAPGNNRIQSKMLAGCLGLVSAVRNRVERDFVPPVRDWAAAQLPTGDRP